MRNIFLEKSYIKCGRKIIPAPFPKIEYISEPKAKCFLQLFFIVYLVEDYPNNIETKLQTTCFYLIYETFKKTKRGLELVYLPHFLQDF